MTREAAIAHLETYLAQVRRYLKGLSEAEMREVLLELRAHVLDKVEGNMTPKTVEAALAALGSPREVGRANVTERVAAIMERDRGFFAVLAAVVRLAGVSAIGFFVFLAGLVGYTTAAGFLAVAIWKPFDPTRVGLWHPDAKSWALGSVEHPAGAPELLGWWIVPLGIGAAIVTGYLTFWLTRACVRAMGHIGRRRRAIV
jgi:hypothetical protein